MNGRRPTVQQVTVEVQTRGPVPETARDLVAAKVDNVTRYANQPVLAARAVLTLSPDPAVERPAKAEATLDVRGTLVRASAVASDMAGALDLLEETLRENLVQYQDRVRTRHRWIGVATERTWRHGTVPTARENYFPRAPEERQILRRKSFAMSPMTPDEAAYDMEVLGHHFYLFTDSRSGQDAVIYRNGNGRFAIRGESVPGPETEALVRLVGEAPRLSETQAVDRLQVSGEPFVFYLDEETGRGHVLYMRYDGHYGLITAA